MRAMFHGYYSPTPDEFQTLWESAVITFDANVLLSFYTYSPDATRELLEVLSKLQNRIWVSNWAAKEYHDGRAEKISIEVAKYSDVRKQVEEALATLSERKRHPFVATPAFDAFTEATKGLIEELMRGERQHELLLNQDWIRDNLAELLNGKVGACFPETELEALFKEAKSRFEKRVPPGYKDIEKPEPARYGDYIIWRELIHQATEKQVDMIVVTDDSKEDWWLKERGKTIGPRPELIAEFRRLSELFSNLVFS